MLVLVKSSSKNATSGENYVAITNPIENTLLNTPVEGKYSTRHCRLIPQTNSTSREIRHAIITGAKLIMFEIVIQSKEHKVPNPRNRQYRSQTWARTTGRQGLGLLFLPPGYQVMSLYTLASDFKSIDVTVKEEPEHCLNQLSDSENEDIVRDLIMNDFQNKPQDTVHFLPTQAVCNMHILNETGTASFQYWCCEKNADLQTKCYYLTRNLPMQILFIAITVFKIVVVLYSPRLLPDSLYRVKNIAMTFVHKLDKKLKLKVIVEDKSKTMKTISSKKRFMFDELHGMPKFRATIRRLGHGVPYMLEVDEISLRVAQHRLLPEDFVPVGFFNMIYDLFFTCKIRQKKSLKDCCEAPCCPIPCGNQACYWYIFLQALMRLVIVGLLVLPWLGRLFLYYRYERYEYASMKDAANLRHLKMPYPGNMTLYLTPEHYIFVIAYCMISLAILIYQLQYFFKKQYNEMVKIVIRKCINQMRETSIMDKIGCISRMSTKLCARWGLAGLCASVVLFPVAFVVFTIYIAFCAIPTANIIIRLCGHIFVFLSPQKFCSKRGGFRCFAKNFEDAVQTLKVENYTEDKYPTDEADFGTTGNYTLSTKQKPSVLFYERLLQIVIIVFCLAFIASFVFLLFEFLSFAVEVFVFTLIGLILNASKILNYVSFLFLVFIYVNDCFGSVQKKFLSFNKALNASLFKLARKEEVESTIRQSPKEQPNTAFRIQVDNPSVPDGPVTKSPFVQLTKSRRGWPRWKVKNLLLFLSSNDEPLIPKHFFFEACNMSYYNAPGDLLVNYIHAVGEFVIIMFFLLFVFVVVMAFGNTYEISAINQMLATTAGGMAPFLLKNFIFRSRVVPNLDTSSTAFQTKLAEHIYPYERSWPVDDITVTNTVQALRDGQLSIATVPQDGQPSMATWEEDECIHMEFLSDQRGIGTSEADCPPLQHQCKEEVDILIVV